MFDGKHILIVDDDHEIRDALTEYLQLRRFKVSSACDGYEMQKIMQNTVVDLIVLDVGLPKVDGIELTHALKSDYEVGIIMLSGHGAPEDRVLGLESGADDYVVKPFSARELLARIHSVLRRTHVPETKEKEQSKPAIKEETVTFGNWIYNTSSQTLFDKHGNTPVLSTGENDLLGILIEKSNTAVSREELQKLASHRDWNPLNRSIDVRVTRLRKKLEIDPSKPKHIRTVRNVGYIMYTTKNINHESKAND